MKAVCTALFCLFSLSLAAQEICLPCVDVCSCDPGPCLGKTSLRNRSPGGIGYARGYSSIDLFYAAQVDANWFPYFDIRGHVFNDGKPAFNTGLGMRYLCEEGEMALGLNFFWDYSSARHTTFHQIGLGAEVLWPYWDLHFNGYMPINKTKQGYRTGLDTFQGHQAIVYKKYETAMSGCDLTIGKTIVDCNCFDLRALLTGYYLRGDFKKDAGGFQFRLRSTIFNWVSLEGSVSYDNVFNWIGQGELALTFPFGGPIRRYPRKITCCPDYIALEKQLMGKAERFEIIATTTKKKTTAARDLKTGELLHFIFVDNTSGSQGTFEDPFPTLAAAIAASNPGDIIYIFPGDGTSTGLDTPSLLQDRQSLIGSAAPFFVKGRRFGLIEIPRQTQNMPQIQAPVGNACIFVANRNLITGLHFTSSVSDPVILGLGFTDCAILSNVFDLQNLQNQEGIFLAQAAGSVRFINNSATIPVSSSLFRLFPSEGFAKVDFTHQNILPSFEGVGCSILADSIFSTRLFFENNQVTASDPCLMIEGTEQGSIQCLARNNLLSTDSPGSNGDALEIIVIDSSTINVNVLNNIALPASGRRAYVFNVGSSGQLNLQLTTNFGESIGVDPYFLQALAPSTLIAESPNSQLSGLEAINEGAFQVNGNVLFAPLE